MLDMNKLKRKIADWIYKYMTFPKDEFKHGCEMKWIFKGNCAECLINPIETLSSYEYRKKYPVNNTIIIGDVQIHLCDKHMKEFRKVLNEENR